MTTKITSLNDLFRQKYQKAVQEMSRSIERDLFGVRYKTPCGQRMNRTEYETFKEVMETGVYIAIHGDYREKK